jgi:hypothetical protein
VTGRGDLISRWSDLWNSIQALDPTVDRDFNLLWNTARTFVWEELRRRVWDEPVDCDLVKAASDRLLGIIGELERLTPCNTDGQQAVAQAPSPAQPAPLPPAKPRAYLFNWPEILDAIGLKNEQESQRKVRSLNEKFDGPINLPKPGGQPMADKDKLITWWNDLDRLFREGDDKEADSRATVQSNYAHGRTGTVVPDISGREVKSRRKGR